MSLWFDLNSTLKTLNLSLLQFFERSGFQNYVCKWQCHKQSQPTWCHKSYLIPQDIFFAWIYVIGITNWRANYGERSQLFFSLFLMKSIWGNCFFFPNLVGCGWSWLLRVRVVLLLTINAWMSLGMGHKCFRVWQVSCQLELVCVFFIYF